MLSEKNYLILIQLFKSAAVYTGTSGTVVEHWTAKGKVQGSNSSDDMTRFKICRCFKIAEFRVKLKHAQYRPLRRRDANLRIKRTANIFRRLMNSIGLSQCPSGGIDLKLPSKQPTARFS